LENTSELERILEKVTMLEK